MKEIAKEAGVYVYIGYVRHIQEGETWRSFNSSGMFTGTAGFRSSTTRSTSSSSGSGYRSAAGCPSSRGWISGRRTSSAAKSGLIFESPVGRFGSLICFESTFSGYSRDYVRRGADFLVNITNDGWFGGARGPLQHSESAVQRAIENGVTVLRAANTGISMMIDPAGRVVESIGLDREGMLLVPVYTLSRRRLIRDTGSGYSSGWSS